MPEELSGGEQQRVAVARALANDPPVILADEPTGDLDSKSAQALMELIKSLRNDKQVTFMLVTDDPIVVARCDRAYAVRDGKITHESQEKNLMLLAYLINTTELQWTESTDDIFSTSSRMPQLAS